MSDSSAAIDRLGLTDLTALVDASTAPGAAWTHQGDDLNVNLLVFAAGDGVAEHVNTEVDVLVVGITGEGELRVDGQIYVIGPGRAMVVPKGARRASVAHSDRFAYLSCHRRRAGLWPTVRPRASS